MKECERNNLAVSGTGDTTKRTEFRKKLRKLAENSKQFIALEDTVDGLIVWIPREEFEIDQHNSPTSLEAENANEFAFSPSMGDAGSNLGDLN